MFQNAKFYMKKSIYIPVIWRVKLSFNRKQMVKMKQILFDKHYNIHNILNDNISILQCRFLQYQTIHSLTVYKTSILKFTNILLLDFLLTSSEWSLVIKVSVQWYCHSKKGNEICVFIASILRVCLTLHNLVL